MLGLIKVLEPQFNNSRLRDFSKDLEKKNSCESFQSIINSIRLVFLGFNPPLAHWPHRYNVMQIDLIWSYRHFAILVYGGESIFPVLFPIRVLILRRRYLMQTLNQDQLPLLYYRQINGTLILGGHDQGITSFACWANNDWLTNLSSKFLVLTWLTPNWSYVGPKQCIYLKWLTLFQEKPMYEQGLKILTHLASLGLGRS